MIIGKPPDEIVDRKEEVAKIVDTLTNPKANVNYALIGHRRIGKSSILLQVKKRLEKQQVIVAYIDLGEFRASPVDFAESLTENLTESYAKTLPKSSKILQVISSALTQIKEIKRIRARLIAGIDEEGKPTIQLDPYIKDRDENYAKALANAFDYANRLSESSKKRVVIIIDEFQHVVDFKKFKDLQNILDILKSIIEKRKNVSFVVSGSRIHYLRNILGEGGSPLFGHFVIIDIQPLEKKYAVELFIKSNNNATENEAVQAYDKVGGHPYYLVMLAETKKDKESINDAYTRILTSSTGALYLYVNYILTEDLGSGYKNTNYPKILLSLSKGQKTVSEISKDTAIQLTTLPRLLTTLIEYDLIHKIDGKYFISDKVIQDFFDLGSK